MKCDQCDSATINGVFCHEQGCPNIVITRPCYACGGETTYLVCEDCTAEINDQVFEY